MVVTTRDGSYNTNRYRGFVLLQLFGSLDLNDVIVAGKHFVVVEAKLILAMMVSQYAVHVDSEDLGRVPDPFDRASFAGVRVRLTNRKGVKGPVMCESSAKFRGGDKKFLLFR